MRCSITAQSALVGLDIYIASGVDIDQVQIQDEVGTVLHLYDLHLCAEGVEPELGVQLCDPVLPALAGKPGEEWLVVAEEREERESHHDWDLCPGWLTQCY